MYRDLSAAPNIENLSLDEYIVSPGQTDTVFTVPVATNETVQVIFEYAIHDRRNKNSRVGVLQVMANGKTTIPNPTPAAHILTEAYGPEPDVYLVTVEGAAGEVRFKVQNATTQEEPIYVSASIRIIHIPEWPAPKLRLTITGMTGGQNINGLSNGVHVLEPLVYLRSPYGGGGYSKTIGGWTGTLNTTTQREAWEWYGAGGPGSTWFGLLQMQVAGGAGSQLGFLWNDGGSVTTSQVGYTATTTAVTGFLRDRLLSNSAVIGAVTLAWEREPTGRTTEWGNY